jgi:hypothetical protein
MLYPAYSDVNHCGQMPIASELGTCGFQRGSEAGPVGVGAGPGLHGSDHCHAQQLAEGQQGLEVLADAVAITRA